MLTVDSAWPTFLTPKSATPTLTSTHCMMQSSLLVNKPRTSKKGDAQASKDAVGVTKVVRKVVPLQGTWRLVVVGASHLVAGAINTVPTTAGLTMSATTNGAGQLPAAAARSISHPEVAGLRALVVATRLKGNGCRHHGTLSGSFRCGEEDNIPYGVDYVIFPMPAADLYNNYRA